MSFKLKKNVINLETESLKIKANPTIFIVMLCNLKKANPNMNVEQIKKCMLTNFKFTGSHRKSLSITIIAYDLIDYRGGKIV